MMKANLRSSIFKLLEAIGQDVLDQKSLRVARILKNCLAMVKYSNLAGFFPVRFEPKWDTELAADTIAYPAIKEGRPSFFLAGYGEFSYGEFGKNIPVPPKVKEVVPDIIVVPGVAFTKDGKRLGRGRGFYDKYLRDFPTFSIGVCFNEQLLSTIPWEEHDRGVDIVITDQELIGRVPCR
jgi:5-formyltetrahydrofolate cyclo-ligase